jgi:hypothetical protein
MFIRATEIMNDFMKNYRVNGWVADEISFNDSLIHKDRFNVMIPRFFEVSRPFRAQH